MLLVWPDFLKGISLEQGSEGGDVAWIARGERTLLQMRVRGHSGVGACWAAIKALATWLLIRQLLWVL